MSEAESLSESSTSGAIVRRTARSDISGDEDQRSCLTTNGRKTGTPGTTPLIYDEDAGRTWLSHRRWCPEHPGWYRNIVMTRTSRCR